MMQNGTSGSRDDLELSIVSTLFKSSAYLDEFVYRCIDAARAVTDRFEIVLVNDCSPDDSLEKALALQKSCKQLRIVDLATNFGHHRSLMTGLCFARGRRVFLIDSDLEEDPSWLPLFCNIMQEKEVDVVFGVQRRRKGAGLERFFGSLFYFVANLLAPGTFQTNSVTARLMSSRYVAALTAFQEREFAIGDLWVRAGFHQVSVTVDKAYRGESSYTWRRRLRNAMLGIISTSTIPLWAIFWLGVAVSVAAAVYILFVLFRFAVTGIDVEGWLSLILSVWLLGGLTLLSMGVIGVYLARIFRETKRRPYVVIRAVHDPAGQVWPFYPLEAAGMLGRRTDSAQGYAPLQPVGPIYDGD